MVKHIKVFTKQLMWNKIKKEINKCMSFNFHYTGFVNTTGNLEYRNYKHNLKNYDTSQ